MSDFRLGWLQRRVAQSVENLRRVPRMYGGTKPDQDRGQIAPGLPVTTVCCTGPACSASQPIHLVPVEPIGYEIDISPLEGWEFDSHNGWRCLPHRAAANTGSSPT